MAQHVWAIVDTQVGHAAGIVHIGQELESVQDEGGSVHFNNQSSGHLHHSQVYDITI